MRDEYDFSTAQRNPYAKKLRKPITIQIDVSTIDYFKNLASSTGMPYQNLINLYLAQCAEEHKTLKFV